MKSNLQILIELLAANPHTLENEIFTLLHHFPGASEAEIQKTIEKLEIFLAAYSKRSSNFQDTDAKPK